jgi:hypothetical protein
MSRYMHLLHLCTIRAHLLSSALAFSGTMNKRIRSYPIATESRNSSPGMRTSVGTLAIVTPPRARRKQAPNGTVLKLWIAFIMSKWHNCSNVGIQRKHRLGQKNHSRHLKNWIWRLTMRKTIAPRNFRAIILSGGCRRQELETLEHIALHFVVLHATRIAQGWLG